jgi:hypothetical protein
MFGGRPAGGKSYFVEGSGASVFPARRLFYTEPQMLVIISSLKRIPSSSYIGELQGKSGRNGDLSH